MVRDPAVKPTAVFKEFRYESRSELARLQAGWRRDRDQLLQAAQLQLDATPELSPFSSVITGFTSFGLQVEAWKVSPIGQAYLQVAARFGEDAESGQKAAVARHHLSKTKKQSDATDQPYHSEGLQSEEGELETKALEPNPRERRRSFDSGYAAGAVQRFEYRDYQTIEDLTAEFDPKHTLSDLPVWQTFYALALFYHDLALQAHDRQGQSIQRQSGHRKATNSERQNASDKPRSDGEKSDD
ncbi:MAG: hypothetical protein AAGF28_05810 [Pseudomonadota bacterium]